MYEADHSRHDELSQSYRNGANWFYWIAGLTIATSLIGFFGGGWRFLIGLGTTQIIDAAAEAAAPAAGSGPKVVALVLDLLVTGTFVVFGVLAGKRLLWAYILGMVLFFLDGLVALVIEDWIGLVAHGVILFFLVRGFMAGRDLEVLEQEMARQQQAAPQPEVV
jgi:hypothetical protein